MNGIGYGYKPYSINTGDIISDVAVVYGKQLWGIGLSLQKAKVYFLGVDPEVGTFTVSTQEDGPGIYEVLKRFQTPEHVQGIGSIAGRVAFRETSVEYLKVKMGMRATLQPRKE